MTKEAIRQAALQRFAAQGYDATSMTEIAGDVGIKAPAIYAHFKGKSELFLELVDRVFEQELEHIRQYLSAPGAAEAVLFGFLRDIGPRFESSPDLRFTLNVYYLPPPKMLGVLLPLLDAYTDKREVLVNDVFKHLPPTRVPPEQLASAYLGVMDGIQAEVLYGGMEKFKKRLEAFWALFRLAFDR